MVASKFMFPLKLFPFAIKRKGNRFLKLYNVKLPLSMSVKFFQIAFSILMIVNDVETPDFQWFLFGFNHYVTFYNNVIFL